MPGNSFSTGDKVKPVAVQELRGFPKNRQCTDVPFLILMISFLVTLVILLVYCVKHGNVYRVLNGYDNCTNVCGFMSHYKANGDNRYDCRKRDFKQHKLLLVSNPRYFDSHNENIKRICVRNCSEYEDYHQVLNRCLHKETVKAADGFISKLGWHDFFQEATEDLLLTWIEILYLCLIGFAFSLILVVLLRFFVELFVWSVLIGVTVSSIGATTTFWYLYSQKNGDEKDEFSYVGKFFSDKNKMYYLACAIVATAVTLYIIAVVIALRKRIKLVVQLFIEAGRPITAMPLLLLHPIFTVVFLTGVIVNWFYFYLWIQSTGYSIHIRKGFYVIKPDLAMKVARFWHLFVMLWICQFILGFQHIILGSSVAVWYFTRNKRNLGNPILYSFYNLIMYHLGSVCLGSLLTLTFNFPQALLETIQKYLKSRKCSKYSSHMYCFEKFLKYTSRNAYIEIAMHGKNFCQSRQQAFKILINDNLRVADINSIGNFVLILSKVLVVVATITIATLTLEYKVGLHYKWIPLILIGTFTYFVADSFIALYEMATDTTILCFCVDCEKNDGISRPYYMSKNLMEFVQNYKRVMDDLNL